MRFVNIQHGNLSPKIIYDTNITTWSKHPNGAITVDGKNTKKNFLVLNMVQGSAWAKKNFSFKVQPHRILITLKEFANIKGLYSTYSFEGHPIIHC